MKQVRHMIPVAATVLALALVAGSVMAGISGSKHDFADPTIYPNNWSNGQICLPCHAPHNTAVTAADGVTELEAPLWNHTLAANSYRMYVAGAVTDGQKVDDNSMLCLSCHDGTIALDSFGGGGGTTFGGRLAADSKANFGTDLSNDHPIGEAAIWPTPNPSYMVDPALRAAARIMPLRPMNDGRLAVGCTSCHEPHDRRNTKTGAATDTKNMLWVVNDKPATTVDGRTVSGSGLCLNCHKK